MKALPIVLLLTLILSAPAMRGVEPDAIGTPARPMRLLVVGDSTVCDYPGTSRRFGWGEALPGYLNKSTVRLVNQAVDGTSTKSFLPLGLWAKALSARADVILIQSGHNDSLDRSDARATDAATEYRANLRKFIDTAREGGATPILVTPMRQTKFRNGALQDNLEPYAQAMKAVAAEKKAPLVDFTR